MTSDRPRIDVLLIQFWIHDIGPVVKALARAEVDANIKRVDIEPAVYAALGVKAYQLVIFDPRTPGLSRETVQSCMRSHGSTAQLVVLEDATAIEDAIAGALRRRQS